MKSPVLVTALVLAASLAACRGSAADWVKGKFTQFSETAQDVASTVTEAAQDVASTVTEAAGSVKDSMKDYVLGPEQGETEYCTDKRCDIPGT